MLLNEAIPNPFIKMNLSYSSFVSRKRLPTLEEVMDGDRPSSRGAHHHVEVIKLLLLSQRCGWECNSGYRRGGNGKTTLATSSTAWSAPNE